MHWQRGEEWKTRRDGIELEKEALDLVAGYAVDTIARGFSQRLARSTVASGVVVVARHLVSASKIDGWCSSTAPLR